MLASSAYVVRKSGWVLHVALLLRAVCVASGNAAVAAGKQQIVRSEPTSFAEIGPGARWANTLHQSDRDSETAEPSAPALVPAKSSEEEHTSLPTASPEAAPPAELVAAQASQVGSQWHLRVEPHRRRRQEHF